MLWMLAYAFVSVCVMKCMILGLFWRRYRAFLAAACISFCICPAGKSRHLYRRVQSGASHRIVYRSRCHSDRKPVGDPSEGSVNMPLCCGLIVANKIPNSVFTGTDSKSRSLCSSSLQSFNLQHTRKLRLKPKETGQRLLTNHGNKNPRAFQISSQPTNCIFATSATENLEKKTCMQCRRSYSGTANSNTSCRYAHRDICISRTLQSLSSDS